MGGACCIGAKEVRITVSSSLNKEKDEPKVIISLS